MLQTSGFVEAGLWRYLFGIVTLLIFTLPAMPRWKDYRQQIGLIALIGIVGLFFFNFFFFLGLETTDPVSATVIMSLNPATTMVFSFLILKTKIHRHHVIGIVLALVGALYFVTQGRFSQFLHWQLNPGDGWMFAANIVFALHHIWVKQCKAPITNQQFTFLTNLFCTLGFVLILPLYGIGKITSYPAGYWWSAAGMGILGTAVAYYLWNLAIDHLGAVRTGIFTNVIPFVVGIMAVLLGDPIGQHHLVGGLLIVLGVLTMQGIVLKKRYIDSND